MADDFRLCWVYMIWKAFFCIIQLYKRAKFFFITLNTGHFRDKKAIVIKMLQQAFNSDFSDLLRELLKFWIVKNYSVVTSA